MKLDTSTNDQFFQYYKEQSQSSETIARFERMADLILKTLEQDGRKGPFDVADIGGGAGTLMLTSSYMMVQLSWVAGGQVLQRSDQ